MPHIWEMFARLFQSTSGGDTPPLFVSVISAAALTLGIAAVGWVIGVAVGMLLGIVMQRWRLAEWGLLPWIVVSQTVPLIAFAPVVNAIGTQIVSRRTAVAAVALGRRHRLVPRVLPGRGRRAARPRRPGSHPSRPHALATPPATGPTLLRLRLPAAVPYLLPALRLAAANAVVGAVVAEVSIGMRGGIGRMLIQLAGQASSDPSAPWGPTFGSIAMGLVAAGSVAILGLVLANYRRGEATA